MPWKTTPPDPLLPFVWCDFNAGTEEGEYWGLSKEDLAKIKPRPEEGMKIFIFDYEDDYPNQSVSSDFNKDDKQRIVVGCEAVLKKEKGRWLAVPDEDTWYSGPVCIPGKTHN